MLRGPRVRTRVSSSAASNVYKGQGPVFEAGVSKAKRILQLAKEHDCLAAGVRHAESCLHYALQMQKQVDRGDATFDKAMSAFHGPNNVWDRFPFETGDAKPRVSVDSDGSSSEEIWGMRRAVWRHGR